MEKPPAGREGGPKKEKAARQPLNFGGGLMLLLL
jgi:hypothetical protein